jgi:hypothetical protein
MGERVEWDMEFLQQRQLLLKHGRLSNHVRSAREGCKGPIIQRVMKADWWCFKMPWQCNWRNERKIVQDVLQKVAGLPLDHLMIKIWPRVRDEHHYLLLLSRELRSQQERESQAQTSRAANAGSIQSKSWLAMGFNF